MISYGKKSLLIIVTFLLLTGCYSREEKNLAKQYEKEGKEYAINYIKNKYGLSAKVKSVNTVRNCSSLWGCLESTPSDNVNVDMIINGKRFSVAVHGLDENKERWAADDYQYQEIEKDLINYFKENIPLDLYDYKIKFIGLIKEYYDSNLSEMLQYIGDIELYYIGENNLENLDTRNIQDFWKWNYDLLLINFKSKENFENYKNVNFEDLSLTAFEMKNIYIDNIVKIKDKQKEFHNIDGITNYKDNVYVYSYKDNISYPISLSKMSDLNNFKELYDDLKDKNIKQISEAYSIPASKSVLLIYFPREIIDVKKGDKIFFTHECHINQEKKYFIDDYWGYDSNLKMGTDGNYYIILENFSQCDLNSEVNFSLIKIH